jgi:hypothetical protein
MKWFARLTGPQVFLYYAISWGGGMWLIYAIMGTEDNPIIWALGGLAFGSVMTPLTLRRRKKDPAIGVQFQIADAVRSGSLPWLINPQQWLATLAKREKAAFSNTMVVGLVASVLGLVEAITLGSGDANWVRDLCIMVGGVGLCTVEIVYLTIDSRRIARLCAEIRTVYGIEAPAPPPSRY